MSKLVKVRIKRAIAFGGLSFAPVRDGNRIIPVEAVIPEAIAKAHGPETLEILGPVEALDAPDPMGKKQAETPADKQVTGGKETKK
jgi:hypothetical protein